MKIAVFDHQLNHGGGKRFLLNLLCALADIDNSLKISLYCNIQRADASYNFNEFNKRGIAVHPLTSLEAINGEVSNTLLKRSYQYVLRHINPKLSKVPEINEKLNAEIVSLSKDFDIAYFPWPYLLQSPKTSCPKVATFHDFNFKYFFGMPTFTDGQLTFLDETFKEWVKDTTPVVSTHFMENELKKFYPAAKPAHVIHLGSLNSYNNHDIIPGHTFEHQYLSDKPYIVFPVHLTSHKNLGNVIAATSIINKDQVKFRLVLTGGHTETIKGKSEYYGLLKGEFNNADVFGLGYISDEQMHYLQQNSFAVINASFYEAGNGVGLDAWPLGVPVIQSDIPAFEEHLQLQGFKAFTFDPRDVHSIAGAINSCLNDPDQRKKNIEASLLAAKNLSWKVAAEKYQEVFKSAEKNIYGN